MTAHLIAEDGLLQGLVLDLKNGTEWILGRSKETADLIIDDSTVSRAHAKILQTDDGFVLQNLSKVNPIRLNDEDLKDPVLLKEGDKILIGETTFMFSEEDISEKPQKSQNDANYDDIFKELNSPDEETYQETIQAKEPKTDDHDFSYETIFEDQSSPVPFSLPGETPFLLKVVSGPNAGAEIGIEKDHTYILGKDPQSCDILFQDLSVSRSHAKLSVSEDGMLEIEDLGSKNGTAVNGIPLSERQKITSSDLVSLGTTVFLIIDREAPQETIYAVLPSKEPTEPKETPKSEEKSTELSWKNQPIPFKHLIVIGSVAAIFLIAFSTFFSLFKATTLEIVENDSEHKVKEALDSDRFRDVFYSFNKASGKLFITGHVLTAVDYQEMRYNLSLLTFIQDIEDSVVIDEGVCKSMNEIISQNPLWGSIHIKCPQPGKFVTVGYLQTAAQLSQLSEFLNLNFPYLDLLTKQVSIEETLDLEIASMILAEGFGAVSYQVQNGVVILSGVYDSKKEKEFHKLLEQIQQTPSITKVDNFAIATTPLMAAVDLSSRFKVSGVTLQQGKGINTIINGSLYSLGDLMDGLKITKIEENTILLEKDGVKYRINFMR